MLNEDEEEEDAKKPDH